MVMAWRTMPQITKYMNTDSTSDIEKQRAWFLKQQKEKGRGYQWIIMHQGKPVGVTSITEIDRVNGTCTRGTYVADEAERVLECYEENIQRKGLKDAEINDYKRIVMLCKGDYEKAKSYGIRAVKDMPYVADVRYNYATAWKQSGCTFLYII